MFIYALTANCFWLLKSTDCSNCWRLQFPYTYIASTTGSASMYYFLQRSWEFKRLLVLIFINISIQHFSVIVFPLCITFDTKQCTLNKYFKVGSNTLWQSHPQLTYGFTSSSNYFLCLLKQILKMKKIQPHRVFKRFRSAFQLCCYHTSQYLYWWNQPLMISIQLEVIKYNKSKVKLLFLTCKKLHPMVITSDLGKTVMKKPCTCTKEYTN